MNKVKTEQAILWAKTISPKWICFRSILQEGLSQHSAQVYERISLASDACVLDVGCGFGDTTMEWGKHVPEGFAVGVDVSLSFIELAREDAEAESNVRFDVVDAGSASFKHDFDLCYSRFGCMFFEEPLEGFKNIRRALKAEGELMLQVWRDREYNAWFTEAIPMMLEILPAPEEFGPSDGPGPFAMANRDSSTQLLEKAGFTNVCFDIIDVDMFVGSTLEEAITFQMANGPVGQIVREADELAHQKNEEIREAMGKILKPFLRPEGVFMPSSSWLIRAKQSQLSHRNI